MFKSDTFKSKSDNLSIYVNGNAVGEFTVYYITEKGDITALYTRFLNGGFEFSYNFDPVSLYVYKNAESFYFEIKGEGKLYEYKLYTPTQIKGEEYNYSALNSDGTVNVKRLDGQNIITSALPDKAVFIGNSLLLGMSGKYGMCSTAPDRDYCYYVTKRIKEKAHYFTYEKIYGSIFESAETEEEFNNWFENDINAPTGKPVSHSFTLNTGLVIIQVMDNVNTPNKVENFKTTAKKLIKKIKLLSPEARIVWVYGWYYKSDVEPIIIELAKEFSFEIVNIFDLHTVENEATEGQLSLDENDNPYVVKDAWITHPGDKGMKLIADKILHKLFNE